jgi:hypothetical protein
LITLPELLQDSEYRKFFTTVPKTILTPGRQPWRLFVQKQADGPWSKKEFEKYAEAFKFLVPLLKSGIHDAAIQSRGIAYAPPQRIARVTKNGKPSYVVGSNGKRQQKTVLVQWKPKLPADEQAHTWCTYCRRPTVFQWFRSHHALRSFGLADLVSPADRRCTICGTREDFVRSTVGTARPVGYDPRVAVSTRRTVR